MIRKLRFCVLISGVILGAVLAGCGGSGGTGVASLTQLEKPAQVGPPSLPAFPVDEQPVEVRVTSAQDNIQLGKDAADKSDEGATPDGDSLLLDSSPDSIAWGMWRWGAFSATIIPESLTVDATPAGPSQYWLLLSNYDTTAWEIVGPLTDTSYSMDYDAGTDYTSPLGYSYAALIVVDGDNLDVAQLNLVSSADVNPPLAPQGLTLNGVTSSSASISWDANSEPDLHAYRIYSNPDIEDFAVDDPGTTLHGEVDSDTTSFTVTDLDSATTYYIRVSAVDVALNESPLSEAVAATTDPTSNYLPPYDLTVDNLGSSWAEFHWTEPTDPDPLGYYFYSGPDADFQKDDPGVELLNKTGPVSGDHWTIEGLNGDTEYFVKGRSYYIGAIYSELSEAMTFTTPASSPPVPAFNYSPQIVQAGQETWFNPTGTTDEDTDVNDLSFMWDFENDGTDDLTTTGPELVNHIYADRGPVTAKLTVSDGTPVSLTKDFVVTFGYESYQPGASAGDDAKVKAVAVDSATGRVASLCVQGTQFAKLRYYNGTSWQDIDTSLIDGNTYQDIALTSTGFALLVHQIEPALSWILYTWSGGSWSMNTKESADADGIDDGRLAIADNGRMSVAVLAFNVAGENTNFKLMTWHEKADSTFATDVQTGLGTNAREQIGVERSDTTSYFLYSFGGDITQWEYTDSTDAQSTVQTYSDINTHLLTDKDPDDHSHVFWAAATDGSRVYYGDNYGTANGGSQYYTTANSATGVLGVGLVGDNEGLFCWSDEESDGFQNLYMYDTTASGGSGQLYDVAGDYGLVSGGSGAYLEDSGTPGIYTAATEPRDGECTGRHVVDGGIMLTDELYSPEGGAHVGAYHQALGFADGSIRFLSEQIYPTAINTYAAFAGDTYAVSEAGQDNWCIPHAACVTSVADEYFVGSLTEASPKEFLLYRFSGGAQTGVLEENLNEMGEPQLAFNAGASEVALFGLTDSDTDLSVWSWDGGSWSADTTIHSGTAQIETLKVASTSDGEWGVAFIDTDENVQLLETSSGVWGTAQVLTTDEVNGPSGIGLDYHADGHTAIVVERRGADPGLFIGVRPDGGSFSWEEIADTNGTKLRSLYSFYHEPNPVVLYYWRDNPASSSRVHVAEKFDGSWENVEFDFQMHGAPISARLDADGNIIMAGYRLIGDPHGASIAIIYN